MRELSLARHHLAGSWPILVMLLVVTVLADRASERLVVKAVLREQFGGGDDLFALTIWIQRVVIVVGLVLAVVGKGRDLYWLFLATIGLVTFTLGVDVVILIWTFPLASSMGGVDQLHDGVILWMMNILVFASWYWLVDTGGRHPVDAEPRARQDLLFPQQANSTPGWEGWHPDAIDYLFVAFSTSTAFSSTDTVFLTRRAKILMMWQSLITLAIVTVILARAVNAL